MLMTHNFCSFCPSDLHSNVAHNQNALQHISSWMTSNLLILNTSKTEFLLIGLKQQLTKIQNCTLNTTHSARNLDFIFAEHLIFSDEIYRRLVADLILIYKIVFGLVDIDPHDYFCLKGSDNSRPW